MGKDHTIGVHLLPFMYERKQLLVGLILEHDYLSIIGGGLEQGETLGICGIRECSHEVPMPPNYWDHTLKKLRPIIKVNKSYSGGALVGTRTRVIQAPIDEITYDNRYLNPGETWSFVMLMKLHDHALLKSKLTWVCPELIRSFKVKPWHYQLLECLVPYLNDPVLTHANADYNSSQGRH